MDGVMVVALGQATVDGQAILGQNSERPFGESQPLCRIPAREFAPGEVVCTPTLSLPQVRHTCTAVGTRPVGCWGLSQGVNDHGVAAGCTAMKSRLPAGQIGLAGSDLVRLVLERSHSARQGMDLLTSLVEHHGQGGGAGASYLIADATEAFLVEATGHYWVSQEIHQVRAAGGLCTIHQDWDRIAHGLAGLAIDRGWWPGDGSKLDFAGSLTEPATADATGLRRWGRATQLLEEQSGHIDVPFVRHVLSDHYEGTPDEVNPFTALRGPATLCRHGFEAASSATATSLVARLSVNPEQRPMAWYAFGPPCLSVYFPLLLDGDLPAAFTSGEVMDLANSWWQRLREPGKPLSRGSDAWALAYDTLMRLQARFDQEADDFATESAALRRRGELRELQRMAGLLMQHHLEQFEAALATLVPGRPEEASPSGAGRHLVADRH